VLLHLYCCAQRSVSNASIAVNCSTPAAWRSDGGGHQPLLQCTQGIARCDFGGGARGEEEGGDDTENGGAGR
jgi:hypothetical protein